MYSPVPAEHQSLVGFIYRLLAGYCEAKEWGKVLTGPGAIRILPDVVREPDIAVFPPRRQGRRRGPRSRPSPAS